MSRHSTFRVLCLPVAVLIWSPQAFSYSVSSSLSYNVGSSTLSGYSRTKKDIWDADFFETCIFYEWDQSYGYYCSIWNIQINYAHVDSHLTINSALYQTQSDTDLRDAQANHSVTTTQSGTWTVHGEHTILSDLYIQYCPYQLCFNPVYLETFTFDAGDDTYATHVIQ